MVEQQQPLSVIPLEYAHAVEIDGRQRLWRRINRIALVAGAAVSLIGWGFLLMNVRTVLFSGPVLMIVGAMMVIGGVRGRQPFVWGLGIAHCTVCVLFAALVNLRHWNPPQAAEPFAVMGGAYNLVTIPATIWGWIRRAG
jgi:hypothetical protein